MALAGLAALAALVDLAVPVEPGGTGIGNEIASLSATERRELKRKCGAVLSNPAAYNRDAVQVCRVLAQLAGL